MAAGDDKRADLEPDAPLMRPALRFLTCGSVDDGKSTLIGRLLYEQKVVYDDQLSALIRDSKKHGTAGGDMDFALLLDGLEAERAQGITIDVAYRYFSSPRRAFVVADSPGHDQYTRNMATAASTCELAVLLVDARKGLLPQTRRHAVIISLLGIRHVVLAINKIDLIGYSQEEFDEIVAQFADFARPLNFRDLKAIPISARGGDNVSGPSPNTPWYAGTSLIEHLETVDIEPPSAGRALRMPVQWSNRPTADFRGGAGMIESGTMMVGDAVVILPSNKQSRVKSILGPGGWIDAAVRGDAITVVLEDEIDMTRGDVLAAPGDLPQVADQFAAHLIWMSDDPLLPGRNYLMKINHTTLTASVTGLRHLIETDGFKKLAAKTLSLNQIGVCNVWVSQPVVFDRYVDNRATGSFILIDPVTDETVAAGMIDFALRRATNVHWQATTVTKEDRSRLNKHPPAVLWFTGLSGAGKSTVANLVEAQLLARGIHTFMLDGDNVRHGLNKDLGFTEVDRTENIRRIGEVAKLMTEAGLIVLCCFISPFAAERKMVRDLMAGGEFIEIFIDAPLDQCIARDPKGLYRKALAGQIKNFTGIDQAYEAPKAPEVHIHSNDSSAAESAALVIRELERRKLI